MIPFISLLASVTGILLYVIRKVTPHYGLIVATVSVVAWVLAFGFWVECGLAMHNDTGIEECKYSAHSFMIIEGNHLSNQSNHVVCYERFLILNGPNLKGVPATLRDARVGFAFIIMAL